MIMADEPTGALDEATGIQIVEILKELNQEGKTILLITHDSDLAKMANRKIVLSDGMIIQDEKEGGNV